MLFLLFLLLLLLLILLSLLLLYCTANMHARIVARAHIRVLKCVKLMNRHKPDMKVLGTL